MKKSIWQNALLFAAAMLLIYFAIYFINPKLSFNSGISFAMSILLPIVFIARAIKQQREENEGMITFGEAFAVAFPVFAIGFAIFSLVNILHLNLDPGFRELGEQVSLENAIAMIEKVSGYIDTDEAALDRATEEIRNNPPKITNGLMFMGFMISLIFPGAVLALIQSAIMKKS